jgi:hypothetical protein
VLPGTLVPKFSADVPGAVFLSTDGCAPIGIPEVDCLVCCACHTPGEMISNSSKTDVDCGFMRTTCQVGTATPSKWTLFVG